MTLNRIQVETELVGRCGDLMEAIGFDVGLTGANLDVGRPLAWALRRSGYTTAILTAPTDDELAIVASSDEDKVLDLTELRLLMNLQNNNKLVDREDATVRWSYGQIAGRIVQSIARAQQRLVDEYGFGLPSAFSHSMTRVDGYSELAGE